MSYTYSIPFDILFQEVNDMDILLTLLSGCIVTIMIAMNGQLSNHFGLYFATVLIHAIGLATIYIVCHMKKAKLHFRNGIPLYLYTGGTVGVLTVFFNNVTISSIGASLVTALGLLGQLVSSLVLEQKGWLGSIQNTITKESIISLIIILIGIGVMLL